MSKTLTFNLSLDKQGVLRVGGRIRLADLPHKFRHPIMLPGDHRFTKLSIKSEHERVLHGGIKVQQSYLHSFCGDSTSEMEDEPLGPLYDVASSVESWQQGQTHNYSANYRRTV